jgi:hypothetical protein
MKFNRIMALAALSLAAAAPAGAALVTFNQGDLLMGFHADGGQGAGQTYVVDIGSAASFRDASGTLTLTLGDIGADLTAIYGAGWSSRTDLSWGIAGSPSNTATINGDPSRTLYASQAQLTAGVEGDGYQITAQSNRTSASTRMQGLTTVFKTDTATVNSTFATIQGDSDVNGWRSYMSGGAAANTPGGIDFGAFSDLEATPGTALGLYRLVDANPASYEGSFSISPSGSLSFTAVPEAASSVLAAAGALALGLRRRRNNA